MFDTLNVSFWTTVGILLYVHVVDVYVCVLLADLRFSSNPVADEAR